jgi:flavin-dependent thymidylate synthase
MSELPNSVELLGYYGSDLTIALSAWSSTSRDLTEDKLARVPALINQLWNAEPNKHKSPFEKGLVHFLVNSDIASHIHLLKHRIASINAESARYKELKEDKYYLPTDWQDVRNLEEISISKNYFDFEASEGNRWVNILEDYINLGDELYHLALKDATKPLGRKRAKESCRYFKTYASQIQADVMFNMSSFNNFLQLRNEDHAQLEIHDIARQMLELVKNIEGNPFEYTIKAWGY